MIGSRNLAAIIIGAGLVACQSGQPGKPLSYNTKSSASDTIVSIGRTVQKCWFKTGDPVFTKFKMASEVNSYAGRPRLLLVPKNNPGGLPVLVIQAEKRGSGASGTFTNVQAFGPLLSENNGSRIVADVKRWTDGSTTCKA